MSYSTSASAQEAQSHYSKRAANYEEANGGWHIELGKDFVEWLSPVEPGSQALDLACGTGLVTLPLAAAIGPKGKIVAVDVTKAMLDVARSKAIPEGHAAIDWVEHDIMDLSSMPEIQSVVEEQRGFDIITCCSALVLLPSHSAAIRTWSTMLKPGGKMVIDVPTEDRTLQYIFTVDMRNLLGLPDEFDRSWVLGLQSLERAFEEAGLKVEKSFRTRSYLETTTYGESEGQRVWDQQIEKYGDFVHMEDEKREEARDVFLKLWEKNLGEDGKFRDGHWLYVVIGRR